MTAGDLASCWIVGGPRRQARQRAASSARSASAAARSLKCAKASAAARSLKCAKRKRGSAQPQVREAQARQRAASSDRPALQFPRSNGSRNALKIGPNRQFFPTCIEQSQNPLIHADADFHHQVTTRRQKSLSLGDQTPIHLQFIIRRK